MGGTRKVAKAEKVVAIFILAPLVAFFSYIFLAPVFDREKSDSARSAYIALSECRKAIRENSINPSKAEIPGVDALRLKNGGLAHVWKPGDGLMLPNEFGAMVASQASCRTSKDARVEWLKIGETVVVW